ncbi:hypothetical protein SAMN02799636_03973 [Methylobacterium sp. 275MFSha3.1]|nr:hypothetical protein SAMN02799636_03973 [Methylobacterium sp. 275MFSha3.1]
MTVATHSFDQTFTLQDTARQFDDLAPSARCDAGPLGKLQSADRLVGKSGEDAGTDRKLSAHDPPSPIPKKAADNHPTSLLQQRFSRSD